MLRWRFVFGWFGCALGGGGGIMRRLFPYRLNLVRGLELRARLTRASASCVPQRSRWLRGSLRRLLQRGSLGRRVPRGRFMSARRPAGARRTSASRALKTLAHCPQRT